MSNHLLGVVVSSDGQHRLMHLTQLPFFATPETLPKLNKLVPSLALLWVLFLRLPLLLFALRLLDEDRFPLLLFPVAFDDDLLNFCAHSF